MAEALELDMVAEGVETVEQATTLAQLGIHRMQGYLFDRPAPADGLDIKSSLTDYSLPSQTPPEQGPDQAG